MLKVPPLSGRFNRINTDKKEIFNLYLKVATIMGNTLWIQLCATSCNSSEYGLIYMQLLRLVFHTGITEGVACRIDMSSNVMYCSIRIKINKQNVRF